MGMYVDLGGACGNFLGCEEELSVGMWRFDWCILCDMLGNIENGCAYTLQNGVLEYEAGISDWGGVSIVVCGAMVVFVKGTSMDGLVSSVEYIGWNFETDCICMYRYITICGIGVNGVMVLQSNGVGICVVFGMGFIWAKCCVIVGVSVGSQKWFIIIPAVGEYAMVGISI